MENSLSTVRQFPLERRKIWKKFISGMLGYGILFLVIVVATAAFNGFNFFSFAVLIELVLFVAFKVFYFWYQTQYFAKYYYDVSEEFLVIRKGVFMPRETTLPFEKLQDVYLDQDLFDRVFNLWDLHVSTATFMSGFEAHIDGVSIENGEAIRKLVLEKIKSTRK
ncbi:MAG TPA: PH domain-containing protein [Candidatus Diapherotrites archaeon]|uniref:PH domain-containing protein n=1 Tax=Candidatus Iainarchaeum sp. TaxID=3101447 RepID=A0A7J4IU64_9ARCH|nr:PH domain-containing protein [Candidatus Diapherotrites archaeon]